MSSAPSGTWTLWHPDDIGPAAEQHALYDITLKAGSAVWRRVCPWRTSADHTGRFLTPFCAQSALPTILRRHGPASCKVETVICPLKSSSSKCVVSRQFVHCSRSSWCSTCVGLAGCVWRKSHRTGWAGFQCFYNSKRVNESKLQYRKRRAPYTQHWWQHESLCDQPRKPTAPLIWILAVASTKVSWASECLMSVTCNNQQASVLCSREPTTWCFWGRVLF